MISKMKLQNWILTLMGFIMLVSICVLVNRLESRKPEIEIRESIDGVNVYNEESKLVDLLQFNYRTNKHYVLTYIIQSFGTEIDIFDPDLLPEGKTLQLEPWEYQEGGYFAPLAEWLHQHAAEFGFYFPFDGIHNTQVGFEPWHISYQSISAQYEKQFNAEMLQIAWQNEPLAGKDCLLADLDEWFV